MTAKPKIAKVDERTELQKELDSLAILQRRVMSSYNFHKIKTLADFLLSLGHSKGELEYAYEEEEGREDDYIQQLDSIVDRTFIARYFTCLILRAQQKEWSKEYAETHPQSEIGQTSSEALLTDTQVSKETEGAANNANIESPTQATCYTPDSSHPLQRAKLWKRQEVAAQQLYDGLVKDNKSGQLLQAAVGTGKTFVLGAVIRRLIDNEWLPLKNSMSPWPIVYVTKASIVEQTIRVLENSFGIDCVNTCNVINIDQLRSKFGDMFIKWDTKIEAGVEYIKPQWKRNIHPLLFIWDECQVLKNTDSQQSLIGQAVNDILENLHESVYQIFSSATPFTRVCEAKCFAVSTRLPYTYGVAKDAPLTNGHWTDFAKSIASPAAPDEHSPAAIERLIHKTIDYIVDIKGLRPQFHPANTVEMIDFETPEQRKQYDDAWERHLERKAKAEGDESLGLGQSRMAVLASFTIFRREAEVIRAPTIAKRLYYQVQEGYAAVGALCFKSAIASVVKHLVEDFGVKRNNISLIWGGLNTSNKVKNNSRKAKIAAMTEEQKENAIRNAVLAGMDMREIEQLIDDATDEIQSQNEEAAKNKELSAKYNLGNQSKKERQAEIDKFQSGNSHYCLFTFKSGGVGLSLHHCDELTTFKCRKKRDSDYVMEEDIPLVPVRQRAVTLTPTYSAIEMVQGLGRCARLTSLSNTPQVILFYRGTIEQRVALTVSTKLKCLKKVVRAKESWESIILNPDKQESIDVESIPVEASEDWPATTKLLPPPTTATEEDDEDDVFLGGETEEE